MYEYRVKQVLKVVDGDTIDVIIDLGFDISFTSRVRLAGIDTPESRTTDAREKILGKEVKDYLAKALEGATDICYQNREGRQFREVRQNPWMAIYQSSNRFTQHGISE